MAAVANNPAFAKKVGIPQSVGKDFSEADKGKKFKGGGMPKMSMKEWEGSAKDKAQQESKDKIEGLRLGADIAYKRAEIRRQISTRKSVQEGKPDRISDLLEEAANELERLNETVSLRHRDNNPQ